MFSLHTYWAVYCMHTFAHYLLGVLYKVGKFPFVPAAVCAEPHLSGSP